MVVQPAENVTIPERVGEPSRLHLQRRRVAEKLELARALDDGREKRAFLLGAAILGTMLLLWTVARVTDPPLNTFISGLAIHHDRFKPFMAGVLRLENVVYYLAVTYFFLLAATKTMEARRWR